MKEQLEKELEKIGLSAKEAKVYLAGLELGPSTAQMIAAKATVNRPTTYIAIESLIKRGLMSSFHKGKKRFFSVPNPNGLKVIAERELFEIKSKQEVIRKLLPTLLSLGVSENLPKVSIYEGKMGLESVHGILVNQLKKSDNKIIDNIAAIDSARNNISEKDLAPLWEKLMKAGAVIRVLYTSDRVTEKDAKIGTGQWIFKKIRLPGMAFKGEVAVCGDLVIALSLRSATTIVVIENKDIADTVHVLFNLAWENSH